MHETVCPSQPSCHHAEMILIWTTMLFCQGYALLSITTVELGDPVTFTCLSLEEYSNERVKWYKQSTGETLTLITMLMKATTNPLFEQGFPPSRFHADHNESQSTLTILRTIQEDEATYHCAVSSWNKDQWSATYLDLKGINQRTLNYTITQWSTVSDPVRPGDSVTLQCSVLSDSDNKTCPGDHSVYWFRAGSDESLPHIIYTDGNRHDNCAKSDTQNRCVYSFSENISSSDAATYHCAVATCGQILFGDGTQLHIQETNLSPVNVILLLPCIVMVITMVASVFFFYVIKENKRNAPITLHGNFAKWDLNEERDTWTAVVFTVLKTASDGVRDVNTANRQLLLSRHLD